MLRKILRTLGIASVLGLLTQGSAAQTQAAAPADRWLINTGEHADTDRIALIGAWTKIVQDIASPAKITTQSHFTSDSSNNLFATRGGTVAMIVGPAHIIGSALRYGHYVPVAASDRRQRIVLATLASSGIRSFAEAKGKSLGLPSQDAIATYLMRGEANAAGTTIKQHFTKIYFTQYEEALLNALKFGTTDTVAVDEYLFERWKAAGEPIAEVMRTKELPGVGIVAHKTTDKNTLRLLQDAIQTKKLTVPGRPGATFRTIEPSAYEYVATLGYFTPRSLPGTELVTAQQAQQLAARGVPFFDGRTEEEFRTGRPAGARFLPYVERSTKETDYDDAKDELDLSKLPTDRSAEIMFSCGGPECWKSYKSARRAIKEGYKKIYWFRGGIHEWRQAGLPVDKG